MALLWKAARRGSPIAQNRLARVLATGMGAPKDMTEAMKWHLIAKSGGNGDPMLDEMFGADERREQEEGRRRRAALVQRQIEQVAALDVA